MRITKISVTGLFGMFDHEIELNQESRITIVHGPNGVGKTMLLRLIQDLFDQGFTLLHDIPFIQLRIEFDNGGCVTVHRSEKIVTNLESEASVVKHVPEIGRFSKVVRGAHDGPLAHVSIDFEDSTGEKHVTFEAPYIYAHEISSALKDMPEFELELVETWIDERLYWRDADTDKVYKEDSLFAAYPELFASFYSDDVDWFRSIKSNVQTRLFQTRRWYDDAKLLRPLLQDSSTVDDSDDSIYDVVSRDDFALGWLAFRAKDYFARLHQRRQILMEARAKFDAAVSEMSEDLKSYSLFDFDHEDVEEMELIEQQVLEVREMMLAILHKEVAATNDFLKLRLTFEEIMNERFLFKSIRLDPEVGIKIVSQDGKDIQLHDLSSGEQHLLVLFYQLLFDTEPDTLVMIDEPELSMNVVWQRNFLKDLERIVELRKFDVLIATHSPEVIYDKWDWTVALGAKVDD